MLRAQSRSQLSHVQQSVTPAKILPPQQVQQKNATTTLVTSPQMHKHNSQVQKIQIVQPPGQPQMVKQVILTPAQQHLIRRQQQINAQRVFLTTSTGTTPGSQVVTSTRNVVMLQASPGSTASKMVATSSRSQAGTTSGAADKLKPKGFTGISRYTAWELCDKCCSSHNLYNSDKFMCFERLCKSSSSTSLKKKNVFSRVS